MRWSNDAIVFNDRSSGRSICLCGATYIAVEGKCFAPTPATPLQMLRPDSNESHGDQRLSAFAASQRVEYPHWAEL